MQNDNTVFTGTVTHASEKYVDRIGHNWLIDKDLNAPHNAVKIYLPDNTKLVLCEVMRITQGLQSELKYRPVLTKDLMELTRSNLFQ